jgi:hypothetical protein
MPDQDVETTSSAIKKAPKKAPFGRDRCAVRAPSDSVQAAIERELSASAPQAKAAAGGGTIQVHFHVVTGHAEDGAVVGSVKQEWIDEQIVVLNAAYASAGFQFRLASQEVLSNDVWYYAEAGSLEEQDMKASLRRGGANDLNLYTTAGDIYLGWATFPSDYKKFGFYDGVVIWWRALPGTDLEGPDPDEPDGTISYNQGDTGTHEVGHWLGLYHTFEGGCTPNGDHIKDTPAEAEPQFLCIERDSCVGKQFPGGDPIHNFMDYVDDACMNHFTTDQQDRMRQQYKVYRSRG